MSDFRPRLARMTNFGGCGQVMPVPLIPLCAISCQIPVPFCEVATGPDPNLLPPPCLPYCPPPPLPEGGDCDSGCPVPPSYPILPYPPEVTPPAGMILSNTTGTTPDGYLLCNGAEVSREQYPILFGATGTYYGAGNGTTTFNVPDLVDSCQPNITYIIKT